MVTRADALGALLTAGSMLVSSPASPADADPLSGHLWKGRPVVVFAAGEGDPLLERQRRILKAMGEAGRERDLVLVEAVGPDPQAGALRRRLGIEEGAFRAVLVGKDGGAKLVSAEPLTAERLIETIDAMPMRRQEMRR